MMQIDTKTVISMSEADQNFSKVARTVDQYGQAVIFEDNTPRYLVIDFAVADHIQTAANEITEEQLLNWVRDRLG